MLPQGWDKGEEAGLSFSPRVWGYTEALFPAEPVASFLETNLSGFLAISDSF
jgi:hypothetical protein